MRTLLFIIFILTGFSLTFFFEEAESSLVSSKLVTNQADLYSYILAITAGVLTLVGLISIFVAINSQHNIQKCRELLWEMKEIPFEEDDIDRLKKWYKRKIYLYCQIVSSREDFTINSIKLARLTIFVVGAAWFVLTIILPLYNKTMLEFSISIFFTFLCIIILIGFYRLLGNIANIHKAGKLPRPSELLDLNYPSGINFLNIFVHSTQLELNKLRKKEDIEVILLSDTRFWNFSIMFDSIKLFKFDKTTETFVQIKTEKIEFSNNILNFDSKPKLDENFETMFTSQPGYKIANIILSDISNITLKKNTSQKRDYFDLEIPKETDYIEFSIQISNDESIKNAWHIEYTNAVPKYRLEDWASRSIPKISGISDRTFLQHDMKRYFKVLSYNKVDFEEQKEKQKIEIKRHLVK